MDFYPGDWLKDTAVRSLSYAARGLWIDMLCAMWESPQRGLLTLNGKPLSLGQLARMTGGTEAETATLLAEIKAAHVCSIREEDGMLFSRRIVRDEARRTGGTDRVRAHRASKRKDTDTYSPGFESWWKEYPAERRNDKRKCFCYWQRDSLEERATDVLSALYRDKLPGGQLAREPRYIPLSTTYLNQRKHETMIRDADRHAIEWGQFAAQFDPVEHARSCSPPAEDCDGRALLLHALAHEMYRAASGDKARLETPAYWHDEGQALDKRFAVLVAVHGTARLRRWIDAWFTEDECPFGPTTFVGKTIPLFVRHIAAVQEWVKKEQA